MMNDETVKLLLIGDNPGFIVSIKSLLANENVKTAKALSGEEGLKSIESDVPDLVLLDVVLPGIDGYQVCRQIKKNPAHSRIMVVMLSSIKISSEDQTVGLETGADGYITRPLSNRELSVRIKSYIQLIRVEKNLARSEKRFRTIFEASPLGAHSYQLLPDNNLIFIDFNSSADRILDISHQALIGKTIEEAFPGLLGTELPEKYRQVAANGIHFNREHVDYHNGQIQGAFDINAFQNEQNKVTVYFSDITARKKAEEERKILSSRYKAILASVPDIIMEVDNNKKYTWANHAGLEFFGNDVIGKEASDYFEGAQDTYEKVDRLFHGNEDVFYLESWQRRIDGEKRLLGWWCRVMKDESGQVIGAISTARDITETNQAAEALRESEEIFKYIFEYSNVGKSITLPSGEINVNKEFCDLLGFTREELQNKKWQELTPPEDLDAIQGILDCLLSGEKDTTRFIKRYLHKNGSIVWADVSVALRRDRDNKPLHFITTIIDITEKTHQEALLKEKDLIFNSLLENSPVYIYFRDNHNKAVHLSRNFEQMLGMPLKDMLEKDMEELYPSPMAKRWIEEDKKVLEEGRLVQIDEELNGRFYSTMKFPIHRENAPSMLAGFTIDITDRKMAELALRQSEARLAAFMEFVPALILIKDHELRPFYANNGFRKYFPFDDWVGKKPHELFPEEVADVMVKKDREALEKGYTCYEETWTDVAGVSHTFFTQKFSVAVAGSSPYLGAIITDITEQKLAEKRIHELNNELEQRVKQRTIQLETANKELEAFSYSVSHDLRAPLRAMNGFVGILSEDYAPVLDDEGKRLLKVVSDNAKNMGYLIDDLLAFSRLSRQEINPSLIDMHKMAREIYEELVLIDEKEKIAFQLLKIPETFGDPAMVRQVWRNLISNAIKFTSPKEHPCIEIGYLTEKNVTVYFIKDNGVGFDMEYVEKLFGVFQRLHNSGEFEGTGVGLAIVQRIIQRHHGRVWAKGKENEGAVFYFTIPGNELNEKIEKRKNFS